MRMRSRTPPSPRPTPARAARPFAAGAARLPPRLVLRRPPSPRVLRPLARLRTPRKHSFVILRYASRMPPHAIDLRRGRVSETGRIYLVTTVTLGRVRLFEDLHLARAAIAHLRHADALGRSKTLAWVLMPDHLHWLVQLAAGDLSRLLAGFKAGSGASINRILQTPGERRWQPGFHDHTLRAEEDLPALARYVIANPVRAGLVASVRAYPHWDAVWLPG